MTAAMSPSAIYDAQAATNGDNNGVDQSGLPGLITAAAVKDLYKQGVEDLRLEIRNYWLNTSFLLGEQNITWDDYRNRPDVLSFTAPNRTRIVNNRIWPSSRRLTSKLLRRPLQFDVNPDQPDDASVGGAKIAEAALADTAREHDWEQLRRDNVWDTWLGGVAALALEWHPARRAVLGQTDEGNDYGLGDTCEYALSIAEFVTEPGCRDIEKARWWIRAAALPPKEAQALYDLDEPPIPDASAMLSPLQQQLVDTGSDGSQRPALTSVLTYYERPNGKSKGQIAVVIGDRVVSKSKGWPFPFTDCLNLKCTRETPMRRRWTGATVLTTARSLQRALNRAETSIDEHMSKAGNARITAEEGMINVDEWDDDPSSIAFVRQGAHWKPEYMSPPQMPAWWETRPDKLKADIDDMLGDHDVSRGVPSEAKSGVALGFLAEQDDTPLGAFAKELAEKWGGFATLVLKTFEAKVTDTRTAKVPSPSGRLPDLVEWTGKDFAGQTGATVPLDAVGPETRSQRFQKGLLMWDKGLFGLPNDPQTALRFARYVDMPGASSLAVELDPDVDKAERENHDMLTGRDVPLPADFDQHPTHIAVHNRFRKSEEFERSDPQQQQIVLLHIQAHSTMNAEEMGRQVALGQAHPVLPTVAQPNEPALSGEPTMAAGGGPPQPPLAAQQGPGAGAAPQVFGAAAPPAPQPGPPMGQGGVPA